MNLEQTAEQALGCVWLWPEIRPLLSTDLLFDALVEARTIDFPELPAALMAQLCQRLWLFPPSQEEAEKWLKKAEILWGRGLFWMEVTKWAKGQEGERTYQLSDMVLKYARSEIEQVTVHCLRDILYKWSQAHGVIAFIKEGMGTDAPRLEDTLLPFRLGVSCPYEAEADFGMKSAIMAIGGESRFREVPSLSFPTMGKKLPKWMDGKSGGLSIWYALLAKGKELPVMPLDIGLAGCLIEGSTALHYHANPRHFVAKKWDLFRRARVPAVVLPDTMGNAGPGPHECTLWPLSESLVPYMNDLLQSQIYRYPDAKVLRRIEGGLVYYEEELDIVKTYALLRQMELKCTQAGNGAHQVNLLAYICCCRLQREPEATEREDRVLQIPRALLREYSLHLLRAGNVAGDPSRPRLRAQSDKLKAMATSGT